MTLFLWWSRIGDFCDTVLAISDWLVGMSSCSTVYTDLQVFSIIKNGRGQSATRIVLPKWYSAQCRTSTVLRPGAITVFWSRKHGPWWKAVNIPGCGFTCAMNARKQHSNAESTQSMVRPHVTPCLDGINCADTIIGSTGLIPPKMTMNRSPWTMHWINPHTHLMWVRRLTQLPSRDVCNKTLEPYHPPPHIGSTLPHGVDFGQSRPSWQKHYIVVHPPFLQRWPKLPDWTCGSTLRWPNWCIVLVQQVGPCLVN